jgi:hypothetical protein
MHSKRETALDKCHNFVFVPSSPRHATEFIAKHPQHFSQLRAFADRAKAPHLLSMKISCGDQQKISVADRVTRNGTLSPLHKKLPAG